VWIVSHCRAQLQPKTSNAPLAQVRTFMCSLLT
jgi:hypothetical protein